MHLLQLVWLIPALPMAGFLLLTLLGTRLSPRHVSLIGVGSVAAAAAVTGIVAVEFMQILPETTFYRSTLWTWIETAGMTVGISWYLDALSLLMTLVITGVGFLIHLYSTEYMSGDEGYRRFFAYMNLFVANMLILVLADNLLLLYVGWEGVGICSYLLIGFWYREPENGAAAQKAFIVTRIGDTAFAVGLFALFAEFTTLSIQEVQAQALHTWPAGSGIAVAVAALLLAGAVGKSAQLPLQVWLPDAMAGPTPVSALIHAATMVTAGVYLIARMHGLFDLAPSVQYAVAIIGVLTLLLAGLSALVQQDIKRILAYSTISQIGYMFLALGVGAWSAGLFHFVTHACFKALLFLAAGAVILSLHHEQDIFRMGGLRRSLPVTFWTFLIGAGALSGLPFITAGFYSKDWILWSVWSSPHGDPWLWLGGTIGALLTGLYSFRLVFRVFFGDLRTTPDRMPGPAMTVPLIALAGLSLGVGFLEIPHTLGDVPTFSHYLTHALPMPDTIPGMPESMEAMEQAAVSIASLLGIGLAAWLFLPRHSLADSVASRPWGRALNDFWLKGWGFDAVYRRLFVDPLNALTKNSTDAIDTGYAILVDAIRWCHLLLSRTQTGRVRWYAASVGTAALLLVGWLAL
jgi:NADH-quinone oxidoreductase subunit L